MTQHQSQSSFSAFATIAFPAPKLSAAGQDVVALLATRHGFSKSAVTALLIALQRGGGGQAQFEHPEFGGMGQWSRGGMLMIGDMFNNSLKSKVGALADEAADAMGLGDLFEARGFATGARSGDLQFEADWGAPSATGSQNDMHYAFFPQRRRVVVSSGGATQVYDTGDHQIFGFAQQHGVSASLSFASQHGPVSLDALRRVEAETDGKPADVNAEPAEQRIDPAPAAAASAMSASCGAATGHFPPSKISQTNERAPKPTIGETQATALFAAIEGLAGLHAKGILSDEEFAAKKTELLARI